ncbi:helix-turn-helix transcriptional regulator [Dickeya ananatis]|uniref:helix-turn-helix domain-containing protein n=1 Tax=Dickeya ananatis TaxID=3061286 RepID=UPI001CE6B0FF|nr:helix-turn-helix transcriptional regulator [Dickeya zeae]
MSLPARLHALRKALDLSQQAMADAVGLHVNSWKKYESGQAMPSVEALKKIATTLHVSTDYLIFDEYERGPEDSFSLLFEAIGQLPESEQAVIRDVLESLIIRYQTRRWDTTRKAAKEE